MTTLLEPAASPPADTAESQPGRSGIVIGRFVTSLLVIGPPVALAIAVPLLWGKAHQLARHRPRGRLLPRQWLRRHRRLSPSVRASQLPRRALVEDHPRRGRFPRGRRLGRRMGREPPPPSRLQRQAGRSALAASTRHGRGRRTSRLRARARRLAVQGRHDLRPRGSLPSSSNDADTAHGQPAVPVLRDLLARGAVLSRLDDHRCPRRRAHRAAVGRPRADDAAAPRDLERELRSVTCSGSNRRREKDHSTNFAPLAILSMGESWHNFHHAHPASARHGALPHQVDPVGRADPALRDHALRDATCAGRPKRNSRSVGRTDRPCASPLRRTHSSERWSSPSASTHYVTLGNRSKFPWLRCHCCSDCTS